MDIGTKIVLSGDSPKEDYSPLYKLGVGGIFKIERDYETVVLRIEEYMPEGMEMDVFPITPGTELFTLYGDSHLIVTFFDDSKVVSEWLLAKGYWDMEGKWVFGEFWDF